MRGGFNAYTESIYWRVKFGHQEYAVKVGKSVDCLRRFNEYRLYYPFSDPDMKVHLILMMPHAVTKEQKSNVDRAETFVLAELKRLYPKSASWPGIDDQFRLTFSRSEWCSGVNMQVIKNLFAKVRDSGITALAFLWKIMARETCLPCGISLRRRS